MKPCNHLDIMKPSTWPDSSGCQQCRIRGDCNHPDGKDCARCLRPIPQTPTTAAECLDKLADVMAWAKREASYSSDSRYRAGYAKAVEEMVGNLVQMVPKEKGIEILRRVLDEWCG